MVELLDSDFSQVSLGEIDLLVNGLTPVWDGDEAGDPFYIWNNHTVFQTSQLRLLSPSRVTNGLRRIGSDLLDG